MSLRSTTSRALAGTLAVLLPLGAAGTSLVAEAPPAQAAAKPAKQSRAVKTKLTAKAPKKAYTKQKITLSGKATLGKGGARRTVVLHVRKDGRWKKVKSRRTDATGRYELKVTTPGKATTRRYRVTATATRTRTLKRVARTVKITKAPPAAQWRTPSPADFTVKFTPRSAKVSASTRFTGTGLVPGPTGRNRKVVLQRKHADNWKTVARSRTDASGRFTLTAPGDWLVNLEHRVYVPRTKKARKRFSQATRLRATPTWTPVGRKTDWTKLGAKKDDRYRWNPCGRAITYRVNLDRAPDFVTPAVVDRAVDELEVATGLRFVRKGSTTAHAYPRPGKGWPSDTDMVISWSRSADLGAPFEGGQIGKGGITGYAATDARGPVWSAYRGQVTLKADAPELTDSESTTYLVLKHELGHAVGLGHSSESGTQVMNPYASNTRDGDWGKGDLAGLRRFGYTDGCISYDPRSAASTLALGGDTGTGTAPRPWAPRTSTAWLP